MKFLQPDYLLFGTLWLIGIGLCAIQLFPTIELMQNANINQGSSRFIFDRFLLEPYHFVTILIPNYFGSIGTYNFWEPSVDYIETIAYIGIIPALFAIFGLFARKKVGINITPFLLSIIMLSIITTIRSPFSQAFFQLPIPIISTGIPTRIFLLSTFAMSILAAFGFEYFFKNKSPYKSFFKKSIPLVLMVLGVVGFSLIALTKHFPCPTDQINCRMVSLRNSLLEITPFFFIFLVLIVYLSKIKNDLFEKITQGAIIFLVVILGLYNSHKYQPFSSAESFMPQNNLINALHNGTSRVFGFDGAIIDKNFGTFFKFYDPQYYHPLYIKRYGEFISYANTGEYPPPLSRSDVTITNTATVSAGLDQRRQRLFEILGVDLFFYKKAHNAIGSDPIWEDQNWIITKNEKALPKAYFVDSVIIKENDQQILKTLFSPTFNPKTTAIIEESDSLQNQKFENSLEQSITINNYKENSVQLQTDRNKTSFLVFSDNYYPGWKALLDGKEIPIYRTNYTFRGVSIPEGKHTLLFIYEPASFFIGSLISAFSLIIFLILFFTIKKGRT
jgi:hypothetical protein